MQRLQLFFFISSDSPSLLLFLLFPLLLSCCFLHSIPTSPHCYQTKKARKEKEAWKRDLEERKTIKQDQARKEMDRRRNMYLITAKRKAVLDKRAAIEASARERQRRELAESNKEWREVREAQEASRKARRRQSIALNNEILSRFREKAKMLADQERVRHDEDTVLKAMDTAAMTEATKRKAAERRQSIVNRGVMQRTHKQLEEQRKAAEHMEQVRP